MSDISTVVTALAVALIGGYLNNFVAEDYKRFRDGQALAGALAGELESHASALPELRPRLDDMLALAKADQPWALPEWDKPISPVFEANVAKIGLLGPDIARQVAYVYEQINAFRSGFVILAKNHKDLPSAWRVAILGECIKRIDAATSGEAKLRYDLNAFARASYFRSRMLMVG